MKNTETLLQEEGNNLVSSIAELFVKYKVNATGQTSASIYPLATANTLQIMAPEHIDQVLDGSGPGTKVAASKLEEWRRAREVQLSADWLSSRIESIGTRLFRGVDPRYPGKHSRRFIIDEAFDEGFVSSLNLRYANARIKDHINDLLSIS